MLLLAVACSEEEKDALSFTLTSSEENLEIGASGDAELNISFTANHAWQAATSADWLTVSPANGFAGSATVKLLAAENLTGETRWATLTFTMDGTVVKTLSVAQEWQDVLVVEQTEITVPVAGGRVELAFETSIRGQWLQIAYSDEAESWLSFVDDSDTRALARGKVMMDVAANTGRAARSAFLQLHVVDADQNVLASSEVVRLSQAGTSGGVSTDLETDDGQVVQLQRHSQGNGVPLVLMGDGFLDTDIRSGYYRQVMEQAVENFFTEEPVKSLRDYFDIWMVTAVSLNDAFGDGYSTKFSCWLEGGGSTRIEGDDQTIQQYVLAVDDIRNNLDLFKNTTTMVILNTEQYAGTATYGYTSSTSQEIYEFAICYCPVINGLQNEMFRRVLCHEAVGHAFAKLEDEYGYQEQGAIPTDAAEDITLWQQQLGWGVNVDFTANAAGVVWSHFLSDERYQGQDAWGETLGVYEGGATYWSGVWRPTNESMMRGNTHGFNAPSREAIYKRLMRTAHGTPWQYDYETFVAFDQAHLPQPTTTRGAETGPSKPFAAPRLVRRPLLINH